MKGQGIKKRKKVFVGMSGGVDSSVSVALLKDAGFDVTGVFIKVWQPDFFPCTAKEDRLDAMRVAAKLNIPFITLNLEVEYKKEVVDYMIYEYKKGRTPNPDVMCNRYIKFGGFMEFARENGGDYIATGHYAQVHKNEEGKYELLKGDDDNKDQSYFLWTLTQDDLAHTLFPVGNIEKPEVRKLALKYKLPTAEKKDSQGLCFIGKIDLEEFLSHFIPKKEGKVLSETGEEIGVHNGAFFFTLGERRGFIITKKTPTDAPYFVVGKDIEANTITVSHKSPEGTLPDATITVKLERVSWISGTAPAIGEKIEARLRYRQPLSLCVMTSSTKGTATLTFDAPQSSVSIGQSVVMYSGDVCLGGGIIS